MFTVHIRGLGNEQALTQTGFALLLTTSHIKSLLPFLSSLTSFMLKSQ